MYKCFLLLQLIDGVPSDAYRSHEDLESSRDLRRERYEVICYAGGENFQIASQKMENALASIRDQFLRHAIERNDAEVIQLAAEKNPEWFFATVWSRWKKEDRPFLLQYLIRATDGQLRPYNAEQFVVFREKTEGFCVHCRKPVRYEVSGKHVRIEKPVSCCGDWVCRNHAAEMVVLNCQ